MLFFKHIYCMIVADSCQIWIVIIFIYFYKVEPRPKSTVGH